MASILYDFTPDELQYLLDTSNGYCDLLRKVGLNGHGSNPETLKKLIIEYGLDTTKNSKNRSNLYRECALKTHKKTKASLNDVLDGKYKNYQSSRLLKMLVNEGVKEYKCEICGISNWNGKDITLVLHHIDGEHSNNKLENLQILCPNCHSQTANYAGKSSKKHLKANKKINKKGKVKTKVVLKQPPISREDLKNKIRKDSFVSIAKEYGVTDNSVRKWCIKYKLPSKKSVIKNIPDDQWNEI